MACIFQRTRMKLKIMSNNQAPEHLKQTTAEWWESVSSEYDLEPHHLRLLTLAAECWDRCQQAREAIAEHGTTYQDRFNQPKARPEVAIERDSRLAFRSYAERASS